MSNVEIGNTCGDVAYLGSVSICLLSPTPSGRMLDASKVAEIFSALDADPKGVGNCE